MGNWFCPCIHAQGLFLIPCLFGPMNCFQGQFLANL